MPLKAVIDTNVWISALINPFGYPARLRKHFERGNAKYIVTRDDDVKFDLKISAFLSKYNISVLTIAKFLKLLK